MIQKQTLLRILIPVFYTAAILVLVIYQWSEQMIVWQGGSSPLYRNLMDYPAYVRHGFDLAEIQQMPQAGETWFRFATPQLRIKNSPLPDLPQRRFLSPFGMPPQEFTIVIPIELDSSALSYDGEPGIFLGYIGENWEIYFNGQLVQREVHVTRAHLNDLGQITSRRNWRGVHFSMDSSLLLEGTNVFAFRIIGDPSYGVTGLYYSSPYYIDDYSIIRQRHLNILEMMLCGIFGYIGIYYFIIFLSVRKKQELYNLFYSISSVLLCVYTLMFSGIVNNIIPNSDISIRLEYVSLFIVVPMLGLFIEHFGTQKITKISCGFLIFYGVLSLTQIFFSAQYGDDVLMIWGGTVLLYFSYVFFYNITFFYMRKKRKAESADSSIYNILIGLVVVYLCGIYDVVDIIFFHNSSSLFLYSTFIFHIGMAITLSQRFRGMYRQLEQSNIILEEQVLERTQELKEQTAIAQEASQAKSNFLAIMSHEIRTPLNAVIGFSEIELRNELPLESKDNIAHIHRSGSYLLGIINEILDISKIESGKLELLPDEYETAPLISATVSLNRARIGEKPIQLILEIDSNFPAKLIGDELRVRQILNNLLSNAIKYTNEGSVKLEVRSEKVEENKDPSILTSHFYLITFILTDTGIGIRPEDTEKLFENYTQLDTRANRRSEGTGLGLVISKNLAEMMGGGIRVESEYGSGSCFTAWIIQELPHMGTDYDLSLRKGSLSLGIGEECAEALRNFSYDFGLNTSGFVGDRKKTSIIPLDVSGGPGTGARVLVVDDIPENLLVARGLLKPYRLHIDTAGSGKEAIELVKSHDYKLIFMDHMMPEMDGVETLKAIREIERSKDIPMVVLTAHTLRGMKEFFLEQGFQDFLSKPISPQALDEVLRNWVVSHVQIDKKTPQLNFSIEMDAQRLDKLNHFYFAFVSEREVDTEYYQMFSAFIESLNTDSSLAKTLIEAGKKEDAQTIRKTLPAFLEAMKEQATVTSEQKFLRNGTDNKNIQDILQALKKAIENGQSKIAGKMIRKLGAMNLNPQEREWYFTLYDSLMEDKTAKALEAIDRWELDGP